MPIQWTFRCYVGPDGQDGIRKVYEDKRTGKQTRNRFLSKLVMLAQMPLSDWQTSVLYKDLHGKYSHIGEIIFVSDNVAQRVFGFRSGEREFTLLLWATKKNNRLIPLDAMDTAETIRQDIVTGKAQTNAIWLALE